MKPEQRLLFLTPADADTAIDMPRSHFRPAAGQPLIRHFGFRQLSLAVSIRAESGHDACHNSRQIIAASHRLSAIFFSFRHCHIH
jgi:hypothetical protein